MRHNRGITLRQGQTVSPATQGCAGSGLRVPTFNGKGACPFCHRDIRVKADGSLRTHKGKR